MPYTVLLRVYIPGTLWRYLRAIRFHPTVACPGYAFRQNEDGHEGKVVYELSARLRRDRAVCIYFRKGAFTSFYVSAVAFV